MKFAKQLASGLIALGLVAANANAAVLAKIGDKPITDDQIKQEYEHISKEQRKAINEDTMTRRNIVDNAINAEILLMAAKKAELDKDAEYQRALERFQRQYLATKFMQKQIEAKLSSSEIKKFYDQNKSFFDTTQVCAHHIVVQDKGDAEKILSEAKAKGANFEALAKKHSIDPTVQENKGNLGCFTRERMVPEFAVAAFGMRKGETKGVIQTMYGYHVIKVDDIKPGKVPGFEEVEQRAKETYRLKLVNELLGDLRTKSNVSINEDALKNFKL